MTWVVVIRDSYQSPPRKVIGPFSSEEYARALAQGLSNSNGQSAQALPLETP